MFCQESMGQLSWITRAYSRSLCSLIASQINHVQSCYKTVLQHESMYYYQSYVNESVLTLKVLNF